ncbi:MAG: peptidylprolyl isomerase [Pirellulales bacterium]
MRHDARKMRGGLRAGRGGWWAGAAIALLCLLAAGPASANPVVRFTISGASFDVLLYQDTAPITVANFLRYVDAGEYAGTVIHRSIPGFIWQGGGFDLAGDPPQAVPIPTFAPIANEFGASNIRGTIAMAKTPEFDESGNPIPGGGPDSATSQWFFNLADNSANLDNQNGGFTVFGEVVGTGMDVVDLVATLPTGDFSADLGFYGNNFTNTPYYVPEGGGPTALVVESISVVPVPEPATFALALSSLLGLAALRRRM